MKIQRRGSVPQLNSRLYILLSVYLFLSVWVSEARAGSDLPVATNSSLGLLEATTGFLWLDSNGAITNLYASGIQGVPISSTAPTSGQCLGYNGSAWTPASCGSGGGGGGGPGAFSFTNQTGVNLNQIITSNTVTLSGFTGLLSAACTGCTAIIRNGIVGSSTAAFLPNDTIALQLTSSSSASTAVTATVTVGSTTSSTWSVTTGTQPSNSPNAFSFDNQTGVSSSSTVISNTVQLSGFTGTVTATCNSGCTNIAINNIWANNTTATGIISGNLIAIEQVSSASTSTPTTATVTVGSTTSSVWTVTTSATPDACGVASPTPGTVCADGSIYAGLSPDGNVKMYAARCDAGMTWNGSACTGNRSAITWNDGSGNYVLVGETSSTTGKANTAALVALGTTTSPAPYQAAQTCGTLSLDGHSDWYLPALSELNVLWGNYAAIGGFSASNYWSSTEYNNYNAWYQSFADGSQNFGNKSTSNSVRCVRR